MAKFPSMHPRMEYRDGRVKNTCAPRNPKRKGPLAKRQARLATRRLSHSQTLKSLPANVNPLAFKAPGSMNPRS